LLGRGTVTAVKFERWLRVRAASAALAGCSVARVVVLGLTLVIHTATPAMAAGSSPVLALVEARSVVSEGGVRLVEAVGSFNFDDLVQFAIPVAGLVVIQGTHFVRYDADGNVFSGNAAALADGLDPTEVAAMLAASGPSAAPARLAAIGRDRIAVVLPGDFTAGAATVAMFAVHDGESFASNGLALVLP
jgi:hypothetical protein